MPRATSQPARRPIIASGARPPVHDAVVILPLCGDKHGTPKRITRGKERFASSRHATNSPLLGAPCSPARSYRRLRACSPRRRLSVVRNQRGTCRPDMLADHRPSGSQAVRGGVRPTGIRRVWLSAGRRHRGFTLSRPAVCIPASLTGDRTGQKKSLVAWMNKGGIVHPCGNDQAYTSAKGDRRRKKHPSPHLRNPIDRIMTQSPAVSRNFATYWNPSQTKKRAFTAQFTVYMPRVCHSFQRFG